MNFEAMSNDLFTERQKEYVGSVEDENLRTHLLHQVRLRDNMQYDRDAFEKQVTELSKWKAEQLEVLRQLNLEEIAKELGIPLGQTIPDKILPAIKKLKNENRSSNSRN